jgi:hypothetical protein
VSVCVPVCACVSVFVCVPVCACVSVFVCVPVCVCVGASSHIYKASGPSRTQTFSISCDFLLLFKPFVTKLLLY